MEFAIFKILFFLINAASVLACDFHTSKYVSHPHLGPRQLVRRGKRETLDWDYINSADWHTIRPGMHYLSSVYIFNKCENFADTS